MVFASASKISYNTFEIHYTFWNVKMRYFCYPVLRFLNIKISVFRFFLLYDYYITAHLLFHVHGTPCQADIRNPSLQLC